MPEVVVFLAEIVFWPVLGFLSEDTRWRPVMEFGFSFTADGAAVGEVGHDDRERFYLTLGKVGCDEFC